MARLKNRANRFAIITTSVGRLEERLKEAIAGEQYELAAQLRDQISLTEKPEL